MIFAPFIAELLRRRPAAKLTISIANGRIVCWIEEKSDEHFIASRIDLLSSALDGHGAPSKPVEIRAVGRALADEVSKALAIAEARARQITITVPESSPL